MRQMLRGGGIAPSPFPSLEALFQRSLQIQLAGIVLPADFLASLKVQSRKEPDIAA